MQVSATTFDWFNPQAKEMVEKAPVVVKAGIKKEEAEALMKTLADAGAKVELV